jgi:hypothetical protein
MNRTRGGRQEGQQERDSRLKKHVCSDKLLYAEEATAYDSPDQQACDMYRLLLSRCFVRVCLEYQSNC